MNFFDHHINDYDEATSHLSAREDGIYHRLLRKYYAKEKPLPNDLAKLQRWTRCRDDEDRQAVIDVLEEFFELRDDGYHQKTCDEVIAAYKAGAPEREIKKQNETNRVQKHREERSRLFQVLVSAGQHAPWNIKIQELRDMVAAIQAGQKPESSQPATASAEKPATPVPVTGAAPATPATATHYPVPTSHNPSPNTHNPPPNGELGFGADAGAPAPAPAKPARAKRTKAGAEEPPKTAAAWDAYRGAYSRRYGLDPVRNAKVNGLLSQLVDRLGAEEAPAVIGFYVESNHPYYVNAGHVLDPAVRDAEKLRTQWLTSGGNGNGVSGAVSGPRAAADPHRDLISQVQANLGVKPGGEVIDV